ncbi:MAG TPA: hypothetical protein VG518_07955, partial [Solirubrobacterales bacterium]|nr:hypothetical protein [Solirubrobacterales bacterium]
AELKPDESLLEHELAIKDLHGRLASVREGSQELERQKVMLEDVKAQAQRTLEKVRPDLGLDGAGELKLTDAQIAKVDAALERHTRLSALLKQAEQAVEDAEDRARELTAELDGLEDPPDVSLLEAAVADAQAEGQVEKRIREAEQELTDAQDALERAVRRLQPRAGIEALREMSPPGGVGVEQFSRRHEELEARARELAERRERIDEARRKFDEEVARLQLSTDVPTVEDLAQLRATRDGEWRRLRRGLEGAASPAPDPDDYERHVGHADDVADRLRVEADSVARKAQLTASERRLEADERELSESLEAHRKEQAGEDEKWHAAWKETGIEPGSPREMIEWLRQREDALARADALARRRRRLESEEAVRDEHLAALRAALAALEVEVASTPTLSGLLEVARARLADSDAVRERYERLARELRTARATAEGQHRKASEQRAALEEWKESWKEIAAANGWPPEIGPDSARKTLADVSELAKQLQEVAQLEARADAIGERLGEFERDAGKLIAELAKELSGRPVNDAVAELARRLEEAVKARSSRQALLEGAEKAREELAAVEQSVARAESELEALVELAGVKTVEELPEAERMAARGEELRLRLPELETQITESGQASLRELIERTEGMNVDALEAQREEAEGEVGALEEQLHTLDVRIGELGAEKRKMESLDGAARAAEELQQRVAELRGLTERYVRLYMANWALAGAIDSYRREHKGPLLKRADELFPELTCGSFQGLEVGFDESDEPILVGVRANGRKAPVGVMSTGTREQLYLALRLASLERYIDAHGPMPVILDDVVLHSDPERKTAILKALAELGRRTQVIAFTHDPQVIALAQSAVDPQLLTIHELGGNQITGALRSQVEITGVHPVPSAAMTQALSPAAG